MKKGKVAISILPLAAIVIIISCGNANAQDIATIKLGSQNWMSKNLDVSTYRNGDKIPEVQDPVVWAKLKTGAWCYYENKKENGTTYGKLYNWYAVNDPRGLAPKGWHIPTDTEWTILEEYLANNGYGYTTGSTDIAKSLAAKSGWTSDPTAGDVGNDQASNNRSGFTALPGGGREDDGNYSGLEGYGLWWSSSNGWNMGGEEDPTLAMYRQVYYCNRFALRHPYDVRNGLSVRCIKDTMDTYIKVTEKIKVNPVEKVTAQKNSTLPVISGKYTKGPLFLAYDGKNVTGFYSNGRYGGNPNFGCSFYFYGNISDKIEDRMIKIKVLSPFNLSKKPRDGTFKLNGEEDDVFSLVANLDGEDCWDKQLGFAEIGTPPGIGFEITEKRDWIEIKIAQSEKVYFYLSKDESTKRKTYVIKGDPLFISEQDGGWLMATFIGSKSETKGWIKKADTKSFVEISTFGKN